LTPIALTYAVGMPWQRFMPTLGGSKTGSLVTTSLPQVVPRMVQASPGLTQPTPVALATMSNMPLTTGVPSTRPSLSAASLCT